MRDLEYYIIETFATILELAAIAAFALFIIGIAAYHEGMLQ